MTTIYLIRHGEVDNPNGILYGRLPRYGLSERGRKQISQTADFLKNKHIEAVYASPLFRTQQTAEIICEKLTLPRNNISKSLLEVTTSFQGTPFANLSPDQAEIYESKKRKASDETIEQIALRYHRFINKLSALHPDETFVAIGHGDPIMALRAMAQRLPMRLPSIRTNKYFSYIKNGEVLKLQVAKDGTITIENAFLPSA
jgi:broad specificity phosphatase PhoE